MSLFIDRDKFKKYMLSKVPGAPYDERKVLLSINTVKSAPKMNCIYVSSAFFFAAQYQSSFDTFSKDFFLTKQQIQRMYLKDKLMSTQLIIETNEKMKDGNKIVLKMNLPKLNRTPWHIENLKRIRNKLEMVK
ncbi:hypothetical protein JCM15457_1573 [Liquorilactobacillus sucicola DSM 21376 = JCM 15457]|uniref:Uncharacterized protein n=1 Tax=Liquorilactobacillus sucicola DSM 21376 = JCM 15457 TaxID=1423806 RepID=A0A023CYQ4_9LACO|nr:hypothetical protein [Liquorilactobacillus sucicola]KRN07136.1 hypothetical protein FD15_GL000708 [Liquorilactobacillus sucicola DSM 21376 = JCM 15457]GAJ26635.1 hypothetical protein JCM15457_1573 [Liquorilactobacillus sucicola DSM 21376 = JCM 15457]